jgi:anti-sigma factor RsiW
MSCRESSTLVPNYFDETLSLQQRNAIEAHLQNCADCQEALTDAQSVNAHLRQWQDEAVPQWQRVPRPLQGKSESTRPRFSFWGQWAPLAGAFVMAVAVLFNVQLQIEANGFSVAFGGSAGIDADSIAAQLAQFETEQRAAQQQTLQALSVQIEERQAGNNARLLETVIEQFGDSTTRSLEQVMAYFEAQRQEDLQLMQASYQRLADSDFQTIRSMQQLASYVQFQGNQLQ